MHFQCAANRDRNLNVGFFSETVDGRSLKLCMMMASMGKYLMFYAQSTAKGHNSYQDETSIEIYAFIHPSFDDNDSFSRPRESLKKKRVLFSSFEIECDLTEHLLFLFVSLFFFSIRPQYGCDSFKIKNVDHKKIIAGYNCIRERLWFVLIKTRSIEEPLVERKREEIVCIFVLT